ncbi:MAG TPA: hypothetical protein VHE35_34610 [Kofleriaceae bacterium]|nr:hypothetical protein [Kofleriaceae bacterium]
MAHDLGLAAAVGGSLFGKAAFDPAVKQLRNAKWREKVDDDAWRRYGPINVAAHAAIAVPWLIGRLMLSGREVSGTARSLTRAKDILVGVSFVTAAACAVLGRILSNRRDRDRRPDETGEAAAMPDHQAHERGLLDRAIDVAGVVNLAANIGVVGVTSALAMEGSESGTFAVASRFLP